MVGGPCGCPHHTGSLKKLGKCHDICREVSPSLGFGVTEPDTVIELIFQNFGLQLKKKKSVLLSTAIFPEASGIAMATECRPRVLGRISNG